MDNTEGERKMSTARKLSRAMSREEMVKITGGLSVTTATIFLAGEMAGSGALKLPNALVGIGILYNYENISNLIQIKHLY